MLIQGDINYFFLFPFSTKATSFKLTNVAHLIFEQVYPIRREASITKHN